MHLADFLILVKDQQVIMKRHPLQKPGIRIRDHNLNRMTGFFQVTKKCKAGTNSIPVRIGMCGDQYFPGLLEKTMNTEKVVFFQEV